MAWLADGKGELVVEIVVQRLDTLEAVYRDQAMLVFRNPLHTARFIARVRDCTFPVDGYYEVTLLVDRELVAHRKFRVQTKGVSNE